MRDRVRFATLLVCLLVGAMAVPAPVGAQQEMVTLTVTVVDQSDQPVPDVELTATWDGGSTTETTAANGQALVDVPKGADVVVEISHPDYVRNDPYRVADAQSGPVEVPVWRKGSLVVDVTDSEGDVEGARVVVRHYRRVIRTGTTGPDGEYATGPLEFGDYTLTVSKPGYYTAEGSIRITGETRKPMTVESGSVAVNFTVTDPHFDPPRPVGNVELRLDGYGTFDTLQNGEATARLPVNTDLTVTAEKDGYRRVTRDLSINESATSVALSMRRTPTLTLTPVNRRVVAGERVVVEVTNEYDEPATGVAVYRDGSQVGETDDEGELAVVLDDPGNHSLSARAGNVRSESVTVEAISAGSGAATATPSPTDTTTPTATPTPDSSVPAPGFTLSTAVLAFLAAAFLLSRP